MLTETAASAEPIDYAALGRKDAIRALEILVAANGACTPMGASHEIVAAIRPRVVEIKAAGASPEEQHAWLEAFRGEAYSRIRIIFEAPFAPNGNAPAASPSAAGVT